MSGFPFVMLLGIHCTKYQTTQNFYSHFSFHYWLHSVRFTRLYIQAQKSQHLTMCLYVCECVCVSECVFSRPRLSTHTTYTHDQMCMCIVCQLFKRTASLATIYHNFHHLFLSSLCRAQTPHTDIWTQQTSTQLLGWFFFSFILFFIFLYLFSRHSIMDEWTIYWYRYCTPIHIHTHTKWINISHIEILLQFVAVARLLVRLPWSLAWRSRSLYQRHHISGYNSNVLCDFVLMVNVMLMMNIMFESL